MWWELAIRSLGGALQLAGVGTIVLELRKSRLRYAALPKHWRRLRRWVQRHILRRPPIEHSLKLKPIDMEFDVFAALTVTHRLRSSGPDAPTDPAALLESMREDLRDVSARVDEEPAHRDAAIHRAGLRIEAQIKERFDDAQRNLEQVERNMQERLREGEVSPRRLRAFGFVLLFFGAALVTWAPELARLFQS
jgi:hypothetical protein